ncbi:MAG TPA: CNNM domain-containing protein [Phycisphaerae bacterium]|jgi:CBS domain containing-hemolysin-like protein
MDWTTPLYILISILLVLMNGFFVLAEFALVKARATRIEELARKGNRPARVAREMLAHLDNYLSATQLGITVASLGLGWIGEPAFSGLIRLAVDLPAWWSREMSHTISAGIAFAIITFLHIWIGELAPKSLAIRRAEQAALAVAYPMRWAYFVFYVPMRLLNGASNWLLRRMGLEAEHTEIAHSVEELRMLLSSAQTSGELSLNRLLVMENLFELGAQKVRDAMIRWPDVQSLSMAATGDEVLRALGEHRFSRWPVLDARGRPSGYLLAKDLVVAGSGAANWTRFVRALRVVRPQDNLETTLQRLQRDGANMAVVLEQGRPIGLITLEDILEEIVGRIEDEYPRLPKVYLKDALANGGVALDVQAQTPDEAIRELAALIAPGHLPPSVDVGAVAVARERQVSTDIGQGVAIPHARCVGLANPILVFGRSGAGIPFNPKSSEPVRLIFLIVTPAERPNLQVFLLSQIASIVRSEFVRERLSRAQSAQEITEVIAAADPAVTG